LQKNNTMLTSENFDFLLQHQYCDNPHCMCYSLVGKGNIKTHCRRKGQVYCNKCNRIFSVRKGTMFFGLRTDIEKIIKVLTLLSSGMGMNAVSKAECVTCDSIRDWLVLAARHVSQFSAYMQQNMQLTQVQIDEFWSFVLKKKENISTDLQELALQAQGQIGDRWTFVAVLPESSFVHTVHTSRRDSDNAQVFVHKIKENSDGKAPLFCSDSWFYQNVLESVYSQQVPTAYCGRGRKPHPHRVVDPQLKYVQVHKKRNSKGTIIQTTTRIVIGDELEVLNILDNATYCKTITTDFVESRNGKYRKDNARLIRDTLCHSKNYVYHDAMITFLTHVFNYTRTVDKFKICSKENVKKFEQKYIHRTPAMVEKLIDKILTIKELLFIRPVLKI